MRLADFIEHRIDAILVEWERFATTLVPAATGMDSLALRDHAHQILAAVASDLRQPQTRNEQAEKSKGRAPQVPGAPETAAQTHALLRARSGFDIDQLVAEYRALRASVLRLWMDAHPLDATGVDDMLRFNEAIDQAVAESVHHFQLSVDRYRNLLLGMLGHDMRSPLNAIVTTASHLAALNAGQNISQAAARLIRSGASMQSLLGDLTDFSRTNLGLGLRVARNDADLASIAEDELDLLRAAHPGRQIELAVTGDCQGEWDGARLQQLLRNLVANALQYGEPGTAVSVTLRGDDHDVNLVVTNSGQIQASEIGDLFSPLTRGTDRSREGLGLGLFIVDEIAKAHGGTIQAQCEGNQTVFAVRLPRQAP